MDEWRIVVGLGNPGDRYAATRHNAGFLGLDRLALKLGADWSSEDRFGSLIARSRVDACRVMLCKPQTYMNASGGAVAAVTRFHRTSLEHLLVVVDDADLEIGVLRLRPKGSSGGHHGLESIQTHLGTSDFARQRIGIGRRDARQREISGHVLGRFGEDEWPVMSAVLDRAVQQIECWLRLGIEKAMNQYNGTVQPPVDDNKEPL